MSEFTKEQNKVIGKAIEAEYDTGFFNGTEYAKEEMMAMLRENSKCTIGTHNTKGFCFCEAIDLIDVWNTGLSRGEN